MKRNILNLIFVTVMLIVMLIILTGSGNEEEKSLKQKGEEDDNKSQTGQVVEIDRIADFEGDTAVVSKMINYQSVHYVIDKNFQVLSSYEGNGIYKDGYVLLQDKDDKERMNIKDAYGNIVFSYSKATDYNKVELICNGCIITEKQTDTYNTSEKVTGVYDLKEQKYILGPEERYNDNIKEHGDNMLVLRDEVGKYFNLDTRKIVKYSEDISNDFKNGYAIETATNDLQYCIKVFDKDGNEKVINSLFGVINKKANSNGMIFDTDARIELINYTEQITGTNVQILNLKDGTAKDLSSQFIFVINNPLFTKDGYALVKFQNQGGTPYYTVIDREGNKLFEPQKISNEASFGAQDNGEKRRLVSENLEEGNYFIVADDGVDTIIDKDNKVILAASEGETFEGITNNVIKVCLKRKGYADTFYYKDFKGNKISIIKK